MISTMLPWSPTTTLSGALWFLCVCVTLTVNTDVSLSRTWCYASDSEDGVPHTLSCNHGNVLWVATAVPGIHTANRRGFCRAPSPSGSDCPLEATTHTDQYRRVCHGRESCTFLLTRRPQNTCPGLQQGPMYLHMEYSCIPATDIAGHTYPAIHPVLSERVEAGSGEVWLVSTGYPMDYEDIADARCSILTDPDTRLEMSILDLSVVVDIVHGTRQDEPCLYSLTVGNNSAVCAAAGLQGRTFTIQPTEGSTDTRTATHIHLTLPEPHTGSVRGRFWVRVTGYQGNSAILVPFSVSCTNPLAPYIAPSSADESSSVVHIVVPIVIILLVIIIIIVVIVGILIWRRRKRKAQEDEEDDPAGEPPEENHDPGAHSEEVTGLWGEALKNDSKKADSDEDQEAGEDENLNKRDKETSKRDEGDSDKPDTHKSTFV